VQALNLNYWIKHEKNDQLLFRFDADAVIVVFTTKYIPVDNFEVMERLDSLGDKPETEVQCHLDPEFMSLSIPDGQKAFNINGDKFKPGISISNSEVGLVNLPRNISRRVKPQERMYCIDVVLHILLRSDVFFGCKRFLCNRTGC